MTVKVTYTQARANLASLLDQAVDDREIIIVQRRDKEATALISADELESLLETAHLLRSPANARRLLSALNRALDRTEGPMPLAALSARVGFNGEDS